MSSGGTRGGPAHPDAVEQASRSGRAPVRLTARWVAGMGVMAWSYLRDPVPVHRAEVLGGDDDLPPAVPDALLDERSQPADDGHGPLYHRRFRVLVDAPDTDAAALMTRIAGDLTVLLPGEVAAVSPRTETRTPPGRVTSSSCACPARGTARCGSSCATSTGCGWR